MGMRVENFISKVPRAPEKAGTAKRQVRMSGLIASGFASVDPGAAAPPGKERRNAPCYIEHYEITIGNWKAVIVKTRDFRDGSVRLSYAPPLDQQTVT